MVFAGGNRRKSLCGKGLGRAGRPPPPLSPLVVRVYVIKVVDISCETITKVLAVFWFVGAITSAVFTGFHLSTPMLRHHHHPSHLNQHILIRVYNGRVRDQSKMSQLYMGYTLHSPTKMAVSNRNRVDYIDNLAQTHGRFFFAQLKRAAFPQVELYIHNPAMLYS